MKYFASLAAVLFFSVPGNLRAGDVPAAVRRYWQGFCYYEAAVLKSVSSRYFHVDRQGHKVNFKEFEANINDINILFDAVKKNDFSRAYAAFMAVSKRSPQGKGIDVRPVSEIPAKDREQFMTMMKRLVEKHPGAHLIRKNQSLKILSVKEQGNEAVVSFSHSDGFGNTSRAMLILKKENSSYLVEMHCEFREKAK